jgi:hypothetical protein
MRHGDPRGSIFVVLTVTRRSSQSIATLRCQPGVPMTAAHAQPLRCPGCAATPEQAAHHDRLLRIDVDPGQLLALFEMAVTWYELDYSRCDVLSPTDWAGFAERHSWAHPERAEAAFSLALDIVGRSVGAPVEPAPALATVLELVRG